MRTLADNHRLAYLPEIAELFDSLKDDAEGVADVTVTSAAPRSSIGISATPSETDQSIVLVGSATQNGTPLSRAANAFR